MNANSKTVKPRKINIEIKSENWFDQQKKSKNNILFQEVSATCPNEQFLEVVILVVDNIFENELTSNWSLSAALGRTELRFQHKFVIAKNNNL